jgi:hypothetical protein
MKHKYQSIGGDTIGHRPYCVHAPGTRSRMGMDQMVLGAKMRGRGAAVVYVDQDALLCFWL